MSKVMRHFGAMLPFLGLLACGDQGPAPVTLAGTWTGTYQNSSTPGSSPTAIIVFVQTGSNVTGTLTVASGRTATLTGKITSSHLDGTFTYTDACGGTAATKADVAKTGVAIAGEPPPIVTLDGTYTANDCNGVTTGTYTVVAQ